MMKKVACVFSFVILIFSLSAPLHADVDYTLWANVLEQNVDEQGFVDYRALKNNQSELDQFVRQLAVTDISGFTQDEQKAFWINAYNALTMQTIIDHYPVNSIRRIWRVWDQPKEVNRGQYTLNQIEHEIVRPMGDARVHFALNCASIGCPRLPQEPFYPQTLDEQLDRETVRFVNDPSRVRLDLKKKTLYISSIFKWFKEDFDAAAGSPLNFIRKYMTPHQREMMTTEISTRFLDYDWGLNDQSRR